MTRKMRLCDPKALYETVIHDWPCNILLLKASLVCPETS